MRSPDLSGLATAWRLKTVDRSRPDYSPAWEATLIHYLLNCPFAHPFWTQYIIAGMHLREMDGVPPAHKQFPDAGYEIVILALDPKVRHDPDLLDSGEQKLAFLTPPDLCHQISAYDLSDEEFMRIVADIVEVIVRGKASPDVDYRVYWGAAIDKAVEGFKAGRQRAQ